MNSVLDVREQIYNHIESTPDCKWSNKASHDDFVSYCAAKDTIQDTAETLLTHMQEGFVTDVHERYIEYYGVLQAIYMQQDAICVLYKIFLNKKLDAKQYNAWSRLRDLRNDTVGHPVGRRRFLNRNVISYNNVNYSWWPKKSRLPKSEDFPLKLFIDTYTTEATTILDLIYIHMNNVCSTQHI